MGLRDDLKKMAAEHPETRAHLVPLLKKHAATGPWGEYETEADEFAALLKDNYRQVKFDKSKQQGSAKLPYMNITFNESGNDSAVVVNIDLGRRGYMKARAVDVFNALEQISDLLGNTTL